MSGPTVDSFDTKWANEFKTNGMIAEKLGLSQFFQ